MNKIDTIIFDLGGVLIDWNPEYVYLDVFNGDRKKMHDALRTALQAEFNINFEEYKSF